VKVIYEREGMRGLLKGIGVGVLNETIARLVMAVVAGIGRIMMKDE